MTAKPSQPAPLPSDDELARKLAFGREILGHPTQGVGPSADQPAPLHAAQQPWAEHERECREIRESLADQPAGEPDARIKQFAADGMRALNDPVRPMDLESFTRIVYMAGLRAAPAAPPRERYRHYKGELYDLLTTARLEGDNRTMAVYQHVESGNIWTRPLDEFRSKFTRIDPASAPAGETK